MCNAAVIYWLAFELMQTILDNCKVVLYASLTLFDINSLV